MEIYEKNLEALEKGQPQIKLDKESKANKTPKKEYTFRLELAADGEKYPVAETEQGVWQLNSRYDPERAAQTYASRYEKLRPYESIVVFGLSDGRALRQMLSYGDETNFWIVYEPSRELFGILLQELDLTDIFLHKHLYLVVESVEEVKNVLESTIKCNNGSLLQHCILPGYDFLYHEICEMTINEMLMQIVYSRFIKNTVINFEKEFAQCGIQSMEDVLWQSNVYQIREYFQKQDVCDLPVIIVAAGPSLNKNIDLLREAKGKAFILGVDAALRSMESHGICPDLALSVDARVREDFFTNVDIQKMPFFFSNQSKISLIKDHKGRHFYDMAPNDLFKSLGEEVSDNEFVQLGGGGSVSTVAYMLALYLGFHTIIFVGQDLAFTGGQSYNKELVTDSKSNRDYIDSRARVWVEDYQGNPIETDYQMSLYCRWLEKEIKLLSEEYKIIDATEGGARIHGTIILSLREAIDTYCGRSVDFSKLLKEVPQAYNEDQRQYIIDHIRKEPQILRNLSATIDDGIDYAKELALASKRKDGEAQKQLLEEIKQVNEKILAEPVQDLLLYYNSRIEYGVAEDIFTVDFSVPQLCEKLLQWYGACKPALQAIADDLEHAL